jgi:hypothetical protein
MELPQTVTAITTGNYARHSVDRASRDASLTLGLTLLTDTVLYLLLPLFPADFGVTLTEVGVLSRPTGLCALRVTDGSCHLSAMPGYRQIYGGCCRRGWRGACRSRR